MANLSIRLTCADYPRVMHLATGEIVPDGIDLTLVRGREGSWAMRAEMLRRALTDLDVQGGEASLAQHVRRIDAGDRSFLALPAFILRNFTARDLYVRKGSAIKEPRDLLGKRIGMYSWTASGSVFYRHFLRHFDVTLDRLEVWIGDADAPSSGMRDASLPEGVRQPEKGRSLAAMVLAGELDALYCPPRPASFHPVEGPIVRLFPDVRPVDSAYFRATGVYPAHHIIVLRRAAYDANPWMARSLMDAFSRANDLFETVQSSYPYGTPWHDAALEDAAAVMGPETHPYGIEKNRRTLDAFLDEAHRAGLTRRRIPIEECFAEFLASR